MSEPGLNTLVMNHVGEEERTEHRPSPIWSLQRAGRRGVGGGQLIESFGYPQFSLQQPISSCASSFSEAECFVTRASRPAQASDRSPVLLGIVRHTPCGQGSLEFQSDVSSALLLLLCVRLRFSAALRKLFPLRALRFLCAPLRKTTTPLHSAGLFEWFCFSASGSALRVSASNRNPQPSTAPTSSSPPENKPHLLRFHHPSPPPCEAILKQPRRTYFGGPFGNGYIAAAPTPADPTQQRRHETRKPAILLIRSQPPRTTSANPAAADAAPRLAACDADSPGLYGTRTPASSSHRSTLPPESRAASSSSRE